MLTRGNSYDDMKGVQYPNWGEVKSLLTRMYLMKDNCQKLYFIIWSFTFYGEEVQTPGIDKTEKERLQTSKGNEEKT